MASQHILTEANQEEMKETLQQLAAHHKKAKLQEIFERQDKLRPHPSTIGRRGNRPRCVRSQSVPMDDDIEAMKSQLQNMHKATIERQSSKQYLLRLSEVMDDGADADVELETPVVDPDGASAAPKSFDSRPYGSDGEHKGTAQDLEEMKAEVGRYRKTLLSKQYEKQFRLRADFDDDEEQEEAKISRMTPQDSEEMENQFVRLSKYMLNYSTLKQLDTRVEAQILPSHRKRFDELMRDIGIVNDSVMKRLWSNIEDTVRFEKVIPVLSAASSTRDQQGEVSSLKQEVDSLREEVRILRNRMKAMQSVPDSGRESQDMAAIVSRGSEDEKNDDGEMLILD